MGTDRTTSALQKKKAFELRKAGKSYGEILKALKLSSKGTLSLWFKEIALTDEEKERLRSNTELAVKRGLHTFNIKRRARIDSENLNETVTWSKKVGKLTKREFALVAAGLFWGEGSKSLPKHRSPSMVFTNSDPTMIRFFVKFMREVFEIPDDRIRAGIHIYPSIRPEVARVYWAKITGLPAERFYIVTQVSRASKQTRNTLPYGTAVIKVNSRRYYYRMMGLIEGLTKQI